MAAVRDQTERGSRHRIEPVHWRLASPPPVTMAFRHDNPSTRMPSGEVQGASLWRALDGEPRHRPNHRIEGPRRQGK